MAAYTPNFKTEYKERIIPALMLKANVYDNAEKDKREVGHIRF